MKKYYLKERFILTEEESSESKPKEQAGTEKINWDKKWAECKTDEEKLAFWTGSKGGDLAAYTDQPESSYYKQAFGENGEAVAKLGKAFQNTLTSLGFTEQKNIWLKFVNALLKNPINGCGVKSLTEVDLLVLIKALKENVISQADLFLETSEVGKYSLIFNPHFYIDIGSANDQIKYLQIQTSFIKNNKGLAAGERGMRWANIYQATGSADPDNPDRAIVAGGRLRSLKDINAIENKANGISDADPELVTKQLTKITDKTKATICFSIAYDFFRISKPKVIAEVNSKLAKIPEKVSLNTKKPSDAEAADVQKIFNFGSVAYSDTQVLEIITYLLKTMEVKLPKEAAKQ